MSTDTYRPGVYAATAPGRPAVITSSGQVVTFGELEERSCRLAQALFARGLRHGDHVAVLLPNDHRTHEVTFGLQRSGLYYTMVNTHLAADEAAYIVADCGARTLITSTALAPLAAELVGLTPEVDLRLMQGDDVVEGHESYADFVDGFPGVPLADEVEGSPMLYSSGTTGHPKGIRRPLGRRPFGADVTLLPMLGGIMGFGEGDVYLSPAPLYHSAPLVWSMTAIRMGGTAVVMEHFDPEACLRPRGAPPGHARAVRPDHVRAHAQAPRGGPRRPRPVLAALGGARRRPVRARGEAPHDRVVGPRSSTSTTPAPRGWA